MRVPTLSSTATYVITAWLEGREWRYQVRHVHSGEEWHFPALAEVVNLLAQRTGLSPLPGRSGIEHDETSGT